MTTEVVITITDFTRIPEPVLALINDVAKRKGGLTEWEQIFSNNTPPREKIKIGTKTIQNVVVLVNALFDEQSLTGRVTTEIASADNLPSGFFNSDKVRRFWYIRGGRNDVIEWAAQILAYLVLGFEQAESWEVLMRDLKAHVRQLEDAAEKGEP